MDENIIKHPGLLLREEIEARGLSLSQVAKLTGARYSTLKHLCHCYFRLAPLMAHRLQQGFPDGRTASEWLSLQAAFDHAKSVYKLQQIRERGKASKEILLAVPKLDSE